MEKRSIITINQMNIFNHQQGWILLVNGFAKKTVSEVSDILIDVIELVIYQKW